MRKISLAVAVFLAALASALAAEVTVTQIKASGSGGKAVVDQRLKDIADPLVNSFPSYSRFDYVVRDTDTIKTENTSTLKLKTGAYLDMTIDAEVTDDQGNIRHTISIEVYEKTERTRKSIFKSTFKNPSGGTFFVGLPDSKDLGGRPIIALKTR